ncbi:divalent-cation tolerance protein CutA [Candidatus Ishikawella capsulata]|nr:divalent-cation tolerance protein CutA [Candidatus Ishikawaella capsulata]
MEVQSAIIVWCTVPDQATAEMLAKETLKEKITTCVTILPHVKSIYLWENNIVTSDELQMLFKGNACHQQELFKLIKKLHPYKLPEIFSILIDSGEAKYLTWLY